MVLSPAEVRPTLDRAIHLPPTAGRVPSGLTFRSTCRARRWTKRSSRHPIRPPIQPISIRARPTVGRRNGGDLEAGGAARFSRRTRHPLSRRDRRLQKTGEKVGIPVVSSFNGFDLIPTAHSLFAGRIGTIGNRAGNFAVQNADVLLSVGSRNNVRQISSSRVSSPVPRKKSWSTSTHRTKKANLVPDVPVQADARYFLRQAHRRTRWCATA